MANLTLGLVDYHSHSRATLDYDDHDDYGARDDYGGERERGRERGYEERRYHGRGDGGRGQSSKYVAVMGLPEDAKERDVSVA